MSPGRCIHCLGRVEPPAEVCPACLDLLSDLGEEDEPQPQPAPVNHTGRFEPTPEDWAAYRELSERGSFRPLTRCARSNCQATPATSGAVRSTRIARIGPSRNRA